MRIDLSIVFLTYLSRSGSTFLASQLNKYKDIGVSIEGDFIDGWIVPGFKLDEPDDLDGFLQRTYRQSKFGQWGVSFLTIKNALLKHNFPILFSTMLYECLLGYFNTQKYHAMVYKGGHYYRCVDVIRDEYPQAKFIFIDRDPRAIFSSQRKNIDSRTGKIMQTSILHFIFGYLDTQETIKKYKDKDYFHIVRYEDLVRDKGDELKKICKFLGVSDYQNVDVESYIVKIPKNQQHLHQNVNGKAKPGRITGWQKELSGQDIWLMETVLKDSLITNGYELSNLKPKSTLCLIEYFSNLLRFVFEKKKRSIFKIQHKY